MHKLFLRAVFVWLLCAVAAPINGTIREFLISPYVGSFAGHAISSLSLAVIIGLIIYSTFLWLHINSRRDALLIGGFWVGLTMLFEFGLGRATGVSWTVLWGDYNVFTGHLWILVLLAEFVMPVVLMRRERSK